MTRFCRMKKLALYLLVFSVLLSSVYSLAYAEIETMEYEIDGFTMSVPAMWSSDTLEEDGITYHRFIRRPAKDFWAGFLRIYTYGLGYSVDDYWLDSSYDGYLSGIPGTNIRRESIEIEGHPAYLFSAYVDYGNGIKYQTYGLVYIAKDLVLSVYYVDSSSSAESNMEFVRAIAESVHSPGYEPIEPKPTSQPVQYDKNTDISSLSFDELISLRQQIDMAIWASDGWQEVEVPSGVYIVGEDIPAGRWTINISDNHSDIPVCAFAVYGTPDDFYDSHGCVSNAYLQVGTPYNANIIDGQLINITGETVVFQPSLGAALGFK